MKVLTWHVREGLRLGTEGDEELHELLLDLLLQERPDIVVLQELTGWTLDLLQELGEEADLPYVELFEVEAGAHHGVLSRTPLSSARPLLESTATQYGAFAVETRDLTVVSAHLSPRTFLQGALEGAALAHVVPKSRTLVLGDFNAVRREERTAALDAALPDDLADCFLSSHEPSPVDRLIMAGFVDAGEVSTLGTSHYPAREGDGELLLRLNYALHTPGIEVPSVDVLDDEALRRASDHLPLVLEVSLP